MPAQPVYPKGLDFEQVWAALMENREQLKETAQIVKEVGRKQEETALQLKETDRIVKETAKQMGMHNNRFGEIVEYMVAPNLKEKFREMGLKFHQASLDVVFSDDDDNALFEVDIFLQNGEKAMLVEVKTKLTTEDVKEHIERLEKMRKYADLHGDKRAFLGAVAGVVMTTNAKKYALKKGFYVIEPSGETFNITPPNGKPKEW
jgi:DNA replicative helicase MCM subunit Mcm2 (Cdc46/Mcm family)